MHVISLLVTQLRPSSATSSIRSITRVGGTQVQETHASPWQAAQLRHHKSALSASNPASRVCRRSWQVSSISVTAESTLSMVLQVGHLLLDTSLHAQAVMRCNDTAPACSWSCHPIRRLPVLTRIAGSHPELPVDSVAPTTVVVVLQ